MKKENNSSSYEDKISTKNGLKKYTKQSFDVSKSDKDLKKKLFIGMTATTSLQVVKFVLQTLSTIVLARFLLPSDYGLVSMSIVAVRFAQMFKDLGLSSATIQAKEINHDQVSTLFWINIFISFILAGLLSLIAPFIANFYGEPRLQFIVISLSLTFIFNGLGIQHEAILQRQMKFTLVSYLEILATIFSFIIAVSLAYLNAGYWALVLMYISIPIIRTIGLWITCKWRPGKPRKNSNIRHLIMYGGNLTGFNVVNFFARNSDNIFIGRFIGAEALGIYDKAYQLLLMPIQQINRPINKVAISTLSRLQSRPIKYQNYYYGLIFLITSIGMPVVSFMYVDADKLILIALGEKWSETIDLFRYLAPAAFVGTFNVAEGWAYQSLGNTDRQFHIGIILSTIITILFAVSVQFGIDTVAIVYGISLPILRILSLLFCYKNTFLSFDRLIRTLLIPGFLSIACGFFLLLAKRYLSNILTSNQIAALLIDLLIFSSLYCFIYILVPQSRRKILSAVVFLRGKQA